MNHHQTDRIKVVQTDLALPSHQRAVVELMDAYAADPMGDGEPLADRVKTALITGLRSHPTTIIFVAFDAERPIGIAVCFRGFSTFAAKPLINISDFYVDPTSRGDGIGRMLLSAVESSAVESGCCKLTLEVQENNHRARSVYESFGFSQAVYVAEAGGSLAMSKRLNDGPVSDP